MWLILKGTITTGTPILMGIHFSWTVIQFQIHCKWYTQNACGETDMQNGTYNSTQSTDSYFTDQQKTVSYCTQRLKNVQNGLSRSPFSAKWIQFTCLSHIYLISIIILFPIHKLAYLQWPPQYTFSNLIFVCTYCFINSSRNHHNHVTQNVQVGDHMLPGHEYTWA